jgi:SAM-dependent methyltransferase
MTHVFAKTARYYDKLYGHKDYAGEVERLMALLGLEPGERRRSLLDVACGTGLHIEHLSARFDVEGLDICEEMLEIARERFPDTTFHLGDMVSFDLGRTYDVVTCLFSSIGYVKTLDRLAAAARSMAAHVAPGGCLAVEPWFRPEQWNAGSVHGMFIDEPELKIARLSTSLVEGKVSVFDLHHLIATQEGTEHVVEHHEMGLFEVEEMTAALEDAGLDVTYDADGLFGRGLYVGRKP